MRYPFRNFAAILGLLTAVLAPASVTTQSTPEWQIGDLFVGIGRFDDHPGQYVVLDPRGQFKEGLVDPSAAALRQKGMPIGTTTGCMVGFDDYDNALYGTTFYGTRVMRFGPTHPHTASVAASISHPAVDSVESIVFDNLGNYYVGGLPPTRDNSSDPIPPYGYIFKYRRIGSDDVLQATYEVPNGNRGVDALDIGTDQETFYYTSQGTKIHEFRPAGGVGGAFYREIQLRYSSGQLVDGTAYSMRALPPYPGDPTRRPSGFLVAMHSGVLRVTYDGVLVNRYDIEGGNSGQYFAMNITPDGQFFWTATFQMDDPGLPMAGNLYKFHIASGAMVIGPVPIRDANGARVRSAWGLCMKREYTSAVNMCFETDANGSATLDASGNPIQVVCRVPEICAPQGIDDDGDGLSDAQDPDCVPPVGPKVDPPVDPPQGTLDCSAARASATAWPPNHQWVPVTIEGVAGAITITGIFQDEPTDAVGDGRTAIDGQGVGTPVAQVRAERLGSPKQPGNGRIYEILFTAISGADSCTGSVQVSVPHDQGSGPAVDDGMRYDSTVRSSARVR